MKIQRFLARAGVTSRRKAADLIEKGRVKVNGEVVGKPWIDITPDEDRITVEGECITLPEEFTYILLNKTRGVITTKEDEFGRETVMDIIEENVPGLFPVGRLDKESEGLLLLTNDGKTANKIMHPSFEVVKKYRVTLPRKAGSEVRKLKDGIVVGGELMRVEEIAGVGSNVLEIKLKEGKNREIRRMLGHFGYRIERLVRVKIDSLELKDLKPGEYRLLTDKELKSLRSSFEGKRR